jgi:hypothetical protein
MYTHVSKCENDKIKKIKELNETRGMAEMVKHLTIMSQVIGTICSTSLKRKAI